MPPACCRSSYAGWAWTGDAGVQAALLRCVRLALRRREGLIVARYNGLVEGVRALVGRAGGGGGGAPAGLLQAMGEVLAGVAGEEEGREEMVGAGLQAPLLRWAVHEAVEVRLAAVTALTLATVGVAMKRAVVGEGGVELCRGRLMRGEGDGAVQGQLLQLLANVMETAKAKALLEGDVELQLRVQGWADSAKKEDAALARSARSVALKFQQWKS